MNILKKPFSWVAGVDAILAGIFGFLYAVSFVIIARSDAELADLLSGLFLLLTGFFTTKVLVALYLHVRATSEGFAFWALLVGILGAAGAMVHGGYDLANAINPPAENIVSLADLPNQVDPRGLLTFGFGGIALLTFAWLGRRSGLLPAGLSAVGYLAGFLAVVLYLGRLILLDATHPLVVIAAVLAGFVAQPLWYLWLGAVLKRQQ